MKKVVALLLTLLLLAGCSLPGRSSAREEAEHSRAAGGPLVSEQLLQAHPEPVSYPLAEAQPLTAALPMRYAAESDSLSIYRELEAQTGVSVAYHFIPDDGYSYGNFVVNIADLPDLILIWGPEGQALAMHLQEELLRLNEYLETDAPNYLRWITRDMDTLRGVLSDEGDIWQFHGIWEQPQPSADFGPVVRQDLLEQYGLARPETYDDWEVVLRALKGQVSQPLTLTPANFTVANYLSAGYGVSVAFDGIDQGFYQVDGVVKYGLLEPEFTDWVTRMADWYREGLIGSRFLDFPDFGSSEYLLKQAMGESAIFFLTYDKLDSLAAVSEIDGFSAALLPDPVQESGGQTHLTQNRAESVLHQGFSISENCSAPEEAVRFVDYLYSDEGIRLCSLGAEGITWQMQQQTPVFTEAAIQEPSLLTEYTNPRLAGVCTRARYVLEEDPAMLEAMETWMERKDSAWHLPFRMMYLEGEEIQELMGITADLTTYSSSVTLQLIVGEKSLEEIPDIQAELREIGVERCLEILQDYMDAYLAR